MQQKATAEFDLQAKTLTITGELLPETPPLHDALVELLHGVDQPEVQSTLVNNNNVLSYRVTFSESLGRGTTHYTSDEVGAIVQKYTAAANKKLKEANSTITVLEDQLATARKVAALATDELATLKPTPQTDSGLPSAGDLDAVNAEGQAAAATAPVIEPAPSNE